MPDSQALGPGDRREDRAEEGGAQNREEGEAVKIPPSIEVLGRAFGVSIVEVVESKRDYAGQVLYAQAAIRIEEDYDHAGRERILLHEALHVIDNELELGLTEEAVRRLSTAI